MKIVGFEVNNGVRLGVVDGDNVIDLQMADANVPSDLGEVLRRSNGDLKSLADLAKNAPAFRTPPAGRTKICAPSRAPRQNHLPGLELSRPRQGGAATRQHSEISLDLLSGAHLDGAAPAADCAAEGINPARL